MEVRNFQIYFKKFCSFRLTIYIFKNSNTKNSSLWTKYQIIWLEPESLEPPFIKEVNIQEIAEILLLSLWICGHVSSFEIMRSFWQSLASSTSSWPRFIQSSQGNSLKSRKMTRSHNVKCAIMSQIQVTGLILAPYINMVNLLKEHRMLKFIGKRDFREMRVRDDFSHVLLSFSVLTITASYFLLACNPWAKMKKV